MITIFESILPTKILANDGIQQENGCAKARLAYGRSRGGFGHRTAYIGGSVDANLLS